MFSWVQGAVASVAGTTEPVYGPDAIHPVSKQTETTPYTLTSKQDQKWLTPNTSCVETQLFYIHTDAGPIAFVQLIYSNLGITSSMQLGTQVFSLDEGKTPDLWCSDALVNWNFSQDKYSLEAQDCTVKLSEDGDAYTITSSVNKKANVNITFKRTAPGFVVGTDGKTLYGTDAKAPWGSMYHGFWPECSVTGTILGENGELDVTGRGTYIHALQGMKPHHCANKWNFANFKSPSYSAILMNFTTPPSYASTSVTVGGIASKGAILIAGTDSTIEHTKVKGDAEVDWPEPSDVKYTWSGISADDEDVTAVLEGPLGTRLDRKDVMAEVPAFVKSLASAAVGTRPYIYQYGQKMKLKIKVGEQEEKEEEGVLFAEVTFIS